MIGKELGRYLVVEALGEGGMAAVYKGYDRRLNRDVAIKVILRGYEGREIFLKRFEREAKAVARLTHPNIVPVIDYGTEDQLPYLVMEYLPGGTLKDKMGQPIPWVQAAQMLCPIARALAYAHGENIIHRDIKPANLLITKSGDLMLTDFGIAKSLEADEQTQLTGTGVGIGTPAYMAPEQGMGEGVDHRVDIYSLGVVLYEMVTGRPPYTADTPMAIMLKHINAPLPRLHQYVTGVPEPLENLLFKALAKDPDHRFQSMTEFAAALENITRHPAPAPSSIRTETPLPPDEPLAATPPARPLERSPRKTPRHPTPEPRSEPVHLTPGLLNDVLKPVKPKRPRWFKWLLIACGAIMVLCIGTWIAWQISVKQDQELRKKLTQAALTHTARALEADSDTKLEPQADATQEPAPAVDAATQAPGSPSTPARIAFHSTRNGNQDIFLVNSDGSGLHQITNAPADEGYPAWSPDGRWIAFSSMRDGTEDIWIMTPDGSSKQPLTSHPDQEWRPDWSPDGRYIVFHASSIENSADLRIIAADGSNRQDLTSGTAQDKRAKWSPDGVRVAFISDRYGSWDIWVINVDGSGLTQLTNTQANERGLSWSPDGGQISYHSDQGSNWDIWTIDADGTNPRQVTTNPANDYFPAWSADGKTLVFHSDRTGNYDIWTIQTDGTHLTQITDHPEDDQNACWEPLR